MPTVREILAEAHQKLAGHADAQLKDQLSNRSSATLEAELLLAQVLDVERSFFYSNPESELSWAQLDRFKLLLQRRLDGEPVAYLLGQQEFWSLALKVSAATLIPRPETELLVELALAKLPANEPCRVADLGTGSGAIALALASERASWQVSATDISADALLVAEENRQAHHLENVILCQGEWLAALQGKFHALVSNPPYIAADDEHLSAGDCRFEPSLALTPGGDGMAAFRQISAQAGEYLLPGGLLMFEHGFDQADQVQCMLLAAGMVNINTHQDLEGKDRVTIGYWPESEKNNV